MKKMRSKIATALVLGAMAFGMFSFTTTPINAQSTNSVIGENSADIGICIRPTYTRSGLTCFIFTIATSYLYGSNNGLSDYPTTALDINN